MRGEAQTWRSLVARLPLLLRLLHARFQLLQEGFSEAPHPAPHLAQVLGRAGRLPLQLLDGVAAEHALCGLPAAELRLGEEVGGQLRRPADGPALGEPLDQLRVVEVTSMIKRSF